MDEFVEDSVDDEIVSELVLLMVEDVVFDMSLLSDVVRNVLVQMNMQLLLEVNGPPRSLIEEAFATNSWLMPVEIERNSTSTRNTKTEALSSERSGFSRLVLFESKSKNFKQDRHIGFHYKKFQFSETIGGIRSRDLFCSQRATFKAFDSDDAFGIIRSLGRKFCPQET